MRSAFLFGCLVIACTASAQVDPFAVRWSLVDSGSQGRVSIKRNIVFELENEFQSFWSKLTGQSAAAAPRIDFTREVAAVMVGGERSGRGTTLQVISVDRQSPTQVAVRYRMVSSGRTTGQKSVPWAVVRINRTASTVVFEELEPYVDGGGSGGWTPPNPGDQEELPWRVYMVEETGAIPGARAEVIHSRGEFVSYWRALTGERDAPRDVDFDREMLLALHIGRRNTSGYSLTLTHIRYGNGGIVVRYVEHSPAEGQRVRRSATSPFLLVRMERFDGPVTFDRRTSNSSSRGPS